MKRLAIIAILLIVVPLIAGCSAAAPNATSDLGLRGPAFSLPAAAPTAAPAAGIAPAQPPPAPDGSSKSTANGGVTQALDQATAERMVVYTGNLTLEVQDAEATVAKIGDILKANQGYISNRALDRDNKGLVRGTITIRVPAGSLDATLTQIKALGLKTLHEDAKSEDVTQEYVDLDARRKNLEAYEVELTQLLATVRERTGKAEDILAVYNQLTEVRGQIEQIKGRQNYLQNTTTLATYTVQFVPHEEVTVVEEGWNPGTTARQALRLLVQTMQGLADVGIFAGLFLLPIVIVAALALVALFYLARRILRGRLPKRAATA